jgi:hypothetical protein
MRALAEASRNLLKRVDPCSRKRYDRALRVKGRRDRAADPPARTRYKRALSVKTEQTRLLSLQLGHSRFDIIRRSDGDRFRFRHDTLAKT